MAEEDFEFVSYKDVSELKKELEGIKGKKDISPKELYDGVEKLSQTIEDMLDVFGAAAEQIKQEDKGYEIEAKKHEAIIFKLDKLLDQNKTIAEGMVAIVEMVKEKLIAPEKEENLFKTEEKEEPLPEPKPAPFPFPRQPEWQPKSEQVQRTQPIAQPSMRPSMDMPFIEQPMAPPIRHKPLFTPDLGMQMPPMEPMPADLDFPEEPLALEEEPKEQKKKGFFRIFKK